MFKQQPDRYVQQRRIINFFFLSCFALVSLNQRYKLGLTTGPVIWLPA